MENLTVGRIVHVRAERGGRGKCQPAIIVQVWEDEPRAYINAQVFRDGSNDSKYDGMGYGPAKSPSGVEPYDAAVGSALARWDTSIYEGQNSHEFHDPRECTHGGSR